MTLRTKRQMRMSRGEKLIKIHEELEKLQTDIDNIEAGNVNEIGDSDTDISEIEGFINTRNHADTSNYVPVTTKKANMYEIRYSANAATVLGDGYSNALMSNIRVYNCTPTGEARGMESKASISGDMGTGSWAQGLYGKVTVSGSSPVGQVDNAAGVHAYIEASSPAAITTANIIYAEPGSEVYATTVNGLKVKSSTQIDYAVDISGTYAAAAAKVPYVNVSPIGAATLATAFGVPEGSDSVARYMGVAKDTSDSNKLYQVYMIDGAYKYGAALTDAS